MNIVWELTTKKCPNYYTEMILKQKLFARNRGYTVGCFFEIVKAG